MSVMAQLSKFSKDPSDTFDSSKMGLAESSEGANGELAAMTQDHPIPGQSLTQSPDQKLPYEQPPKFTEQQPFLDHLFEAVVQPKTLTGLLDGMRLGIPVEDVALKVLRKQMQIGSLNMDLMMLCVEPTIYMLIALATYAEIDPVLAPEHSNEDDMSTMAAQFATASAKLSSNADVSDGLTVEELNKPTVTPTGLMAKSQKAVEALGTNGTEGEL